MRTKKKARLYGRAGQERSGKGSRSCYFNEANGSIAVDAPWEIGEAFRFIDEIGSTYADLSAADVMEVFA